MLLVFGGFLLLLQPGWPVLVYAVLMLAFGAINIAALYRLKTARTSLAGYVSGRISAALCYR